MRRASLRVDNVSYAPGGDWLLEIAFDDKGTKKVAAKFAKMTKI